MPPPTSGVLISAAVRVLAHAVAIEIETVAAAAPPAARAAVARTQHAQDLHAAGHAVTTMDPAALPGAVHMQAGPPFPLVSPLPPLPSPPPPPPPAAVPRLPLSGTVPLSPELPDSEASRPSVQSSPGETHLLSTPKLLSSVPEPKAEPKTEPKPEPKTQPRPVSLLAASQTKPAPELIADVNAAPAVAPPAAPSVPLASTAVLLEPPAAVKSAAPVVETERPAAEASALKAESPASKLPVVDVDPDEVSPHLQECI